MEGAEYSKIFAMTDKDGNARPAEAYANLVDGFCKFTNELPSRPGYNTTGKQIAIRVNQYKVTKFPTADIGQYDINYGIPARSDGAPPKAGLLMAIYKSQAVQRALQQHGDIWLWDGQKLIWSLATVPEVRVQVNLDKERGRPARPDKQAEVYYVKITRTKSVRMDVIRAYLKGQMQFDNSVFEGINFLDHLLREYPSTHPNELVAQKRSYFSRGVNTTPLDTVISASKGVYSSIRLCDPNGGASSGLAINVDVANGTFWTGQDLHQSIRNFVQVLTNTRSLDYAGLAQRLAPRSLGNGRFTMPDSFKELRKYAKLKFRLKCPPLPGQHPNPKLAQQKIFTIKGIAFDQKYGPTGCNPKTMVFEITDRNTGAKRSISVFDHFRQRYGFICNYPLLPLIETTRDGFIPMEAAELLGYQKYQYKLDPNQTAAMIKFAVTRPKQRLESIHTGVGMLKWAQDQNLKKFGLEMERYFTVTNAKLLQNPEIQFKGSKINPGTTGRWDLRGKKLWTPNMAPLKSWGVLVVDNCADEATVKNFMNVFIQTYTGHGGNIVNKNPIIQASPPRTDHVANAAKLRNAVGNAAQQSPQIIFIIMGNRDSFLYERLKRCMECRFGMVSQMIAVNHCRKAAPQYCSNVSMKVNAKLGGITCKIASPNPKAFPVPTMIVGADVSHASPGSVQPSIAAITMSMDPDCLKYAAHVQSNGFRVEVISEENIRAGFMQLFKYWVDSARTGPSHIYYFRDGVSEGQYKAILEDEVGHMKTAIYDMYKEKAAGIKWTITVCSKRHHIRFFPKDGDMQAGDKNGNALPGTLVERDVTHPFQYDFYLSSHSAIQGTARPTHYHVIQDEAKLKPTDFQNMVYKHCYQYARSTTPVSLYPAVYYAHLASNRARCHNSDDARDGPTGGQKFEEARADEVVLRNVGAISKGPSSLTSSKNKDSKAKPLVPLAQDSKDPAFIKAIRTAMWYI